MFKPNMEDKMAKVIILNKTIVPIHGLQPKKTMEIEVDKDGTPLDRHWRRRFRDAEIDGCIEIVKEKKIKNKKEEDKE